MSSHDTNPSDCARSQIDAIRRSNLKIQLILSLIPGCILASIFFSGEAGLLIYLFASVVGLIVVSSLVDRRDVCPKCKHGISSLPNEGHFRLPRLSRTIHLCPFCGADFDEEIVWLDLPVAVDQDRT